MTRLIVTVESTGKQLGWAELGDDGQVTASSAAVRRLFTPRRPGQTEADLFRQYVKGWSNGYLAVTPAPTMEP